MNSFADLIQTYGPTIAITAVFVWQGILRENRMCARLAIQDDAIQSILTGVIVRNTDALTRFTLVIARKPCGVNLTQDAQS